MAGMQTGGSDRSWLFDPQTVDEIGPIASKLIHYDKYFEKEHGTTTLMIVLDKILDELPPELEETVRLVFIAGLSYRSAAKTLGIDHKTVKARSIRGVNALRKRLLDTVWLSALLTGLVPEDAIESTSVTSGDTALSVLSKLSKKEK